MIVCKIHGQCLTVAQPRTVSDTIDYIGLQAEFSPDWGGMTSIWAHIADATGTVYDFLLHDGRAEWLNLAAGEYRIYFHGTDGERRITTEERTITVKPTGVLDGEPLPEIAPSAAEQIAADAAEAREIAQSVRDDADAGVFDGPQGPQGPAGSDASVTAQNIEAALGYTPANPSDLATVATTGSYNDLTDKPTVFGNEVEVGPTPEDADLWIDTNGSDTYVDPSVRWDVEQNLSDAQKERARNNIGAVVTSDSIENALGYTPADAEDVNDIKGDIVQQEERIVALEAGGTGGNIADSDETESSFDIADNGGYVLARFHDGHIRTKRFDSSKLAAKMVYPKQFTSRLKPNVYRIGGAYAADFDITAHRIAGTSECWVSASAAADGDGTREKPYNNINIALSNATTIHLMDGTYLVNTHFNTSVNVAGHNLIGDGNVVLDCTAATNCPFRCNDASGYIENVEIVGGAYNYYVSQNDSGYAYLYKVRMHGAANNALYVLGGNVYCVECVAYDAALDGFNYHKNSDGSVPNAVEIDCVAYDCGIGSSNDSCNGSTIHDGARIVRVNGEYHHTHGGVIADKGSEDGTPSQSVNFGVYAHDSTQTGGGYAASFWAQMHQQMWLIDCRASGSVYDISSYDNASVYALDLMTDDFDAHDYTASSGTVVRK